MHIKAFFEINHEGDPIHSIDFHPSGTKIITAGCGNGEFGGLIVVWDISGLYNGNNDIIQLGSTQFTKPVNCARFSPDGKQIAVGDDSNIITLLKLRKRTRTHDGRIREDYNIINNIVGHSADVLQVQYSVNGSMLASTSADCTVKIWSVEHFPRCLAVLKEERNGHRDSVKGCAWDPIGRYLATHSADKSVKIWTTDSWECVFTLTEPFKDSSYNVLFNRMAWTPDGVGLIIPGATNNTFPTAQILIRGDWTYAKDFVGHEKNLSVASVCNEMRILQDKKTGKKYYGYIVALGGSDRSLSIWSFPRTRRPVVVIHNIVDQPILDMKWYGRCLALCSMDGTVRFLTFKEAEIGQALTKSQFQQHCLKKYGFLPSGIFSNDTEKETEDIDICDYWDKKISSIPGQIKFDWKEDEPTHKLPKKVKKVKLTVDEKKDEPQQAVQMMFKSKKAIKLTSCQVEDENVEEEPEKEKVVQLQVEPTNTEPQTINESFSGINEIQDKFLYEFVFKNEQQLNDIDKDVNIISKEFKKHDQLKPKSFYILNPLDGGKRDPNNMITIINDKILGGGSSLSRIQNLKLGLDITVEGHVLACDLNNDCLVLLTTKKDVIVIDRKTGKEDKIYHFDENPVGFFVFYNYAFILLDNLQFHFINITDNNFNRGHICTCSIKEFGTFDDIQLYGTNGIPLLITNKNKTMYAGISDKGCWYKLMTIENDIQLFNLEKASDLLTQCLQAYHQTITWKK